MKLLIKAARVVDASSPHNGRKCDILVEGGRIAAVRASIPAKGLKTYSAENLHLSPGWFDMHVNFRDPGYEYKESLISGCRAAMQGGFTGVACMPSTLPPNDSKAGIEYIIHKTSSHLVDVHPVGALSLNCAGSELTEMYDMHAAGAVAFSDDKRPVLNANLLLRALLYVRDFGGMIISFPYESTISKRGIANEGESATRLGMSGIPALSEELMVNRDLYINGYAASRLHFSMISASGAVKLIREARRKGIRVTAGVTAHHLALDDSTLAAFDSNYKVLPPLRTPADVEALKQGLKDGTIDVICSDHSPEDEESKRVEFDVAAFGITGLETAFAVANTALRGVIRINRLIEKIAVNPRKILGLPVPSVREGEKANLTLFDPAREWVFEKQHIASKSSNTPFTGMKFTGKVLAVYNNGQFVVSC